MVINWLRFIAYSRYDMCLVFCIYSPCCIALQQSCYIVNDMKTLNVKQEEEEGGLKCFPTCFMFGGRNLMLILMIDDTGFSVEPQCVCVWVCDSVIVSTMNSTTISAPSPQREPESKQKYPLSSSSSRNALHLYPPSPSLPPFLCPPFLA